MIQGMVNHDVADAMVRSYRLEAAAARTPLGVAPSRNGPSRVRRALGHWMVAVGQRLDGSAAAPAAGDHCR
jgi:hypothetical protein